MLRLFCLLVICLLMNGAVSSQNADTGIIKSVDTSKPVKPAITVKPVTRPQKDTLSVVDTQASIPARPVMLDDTSVSRRPFISRGIWDLKPDTGFVEQILNQHPYFNFHSIPVAVPSQVRIFKGKELLFYVMVLLFMIFALLKLVFGKYYNDLFRVFFRTTMKQRQIREQLMQTPLPSLLFNIFYVATAALYLSFLFREYEFELAQNFWLLYFYCCIGLSLIYFFKFIGLKLCGWLFNMRQAADSYIFIVFIINKVIGIFLLPVLALLAFSEGLVYQVTLAISWCGIGLLFFYRFILGYGVIRNEVRFNLFHFFLYLCAFEVAPLLLIYRVLLFVFK